MGERRTIVWGPASKGVGGHPLPRTVAEEDDGTVERRWVCLATLGPIGVASLVYIVVVVGFIEAEAGEALAWPLLGGLPMFVFGMWLLTVSSSRTAVLIALAATAMIVGSAYETFVQRNIEILGEPWFPLFNMIGLTADAVATSAFLIVFATFPDGVPERRWQRIAVAFLWVPVLVGPLTLLTTPHVVMSQYIGISGDAIANPYRGALARVGGPRGELPRLPGVAGGRPRPLGARIPCAVRRARGARSHARHRDHRRRLVAGVRAVDVRARHLGRRSSSSTPR